MEFEQNLINGIHVVRILEKKLTSHEAPDLKTALLSWIMADGQHLLLNLGGVEQMDSTGLGALLFGIRQAERQGKDLSICMMQRKIRFLVRIAHLEDVISIYEAEDDAITELGLDETET